MLATTGHNHYATLGVRGDATAAQIAQAYARRLRALPARGPRCWLAWLRGEGPASLARAHAVLSDPAQRVAYDRLLDDRVVTACAHPWF